MLTHQTEEPFRGSDAVAAGHVTPAALRGPSFRPLFRDVFVGASADIDIAARVQAVALRAGPGAVVAGPLAALAWGAECPWDDAEVVLTTDRRLSREGIRLRTCRLDRSDVARCHGVVVTSPDRTAFDLACRSGPLPDVVAAVDALAQRCRFGPGTLRSVIAAHPGARGLVAAREVVELMNPKAESLMESRTRLLFVLRGLPAPECQLRVRLPSGRHARLDLAWRERKVAVEYDGDEHRDAPRHADDLDRDAGLDDLGWDVTRVTGRQVYRAPDALVARIARKLGLAA